MPFKLGIAMKIHELLCQATEPGQVLTYSEICKRVQDLLPDVKLRSILPSEHMQGKETICKLCHEQPIFEKLGHGLYRVLSRSPVLPLLSIHDKLAQILAESHYQHLNITQLRQAVLARFPETHVPSIIPLDHTLGGACRVCQSRPLLERTGQRGVFRVLPNSEPMLASQNPFSRAVAFLYDYLDQGKADDFIKPSAALLKIIGQIPDLSSGQITVLKTALFQRVVIDIKEFGHLLEPEILHARLALRLYEQEGIELSLAHWAVEVWAWVLEKLSATQVYASTTFVQLQVADRALSWSSPLSADLKLQFLNPVPLDKKMIWLKKNKQRIALLIEPEQHCILGIRVGLKAFVPSRWSHLAISHAQIPLNLPLSEREKQAYTWFLCQNQENLLPFLTWLDQFCGTDKA